MINGIIEGRWKGQSFLFQNGQWCVSGQPVLHEVAGYEVVDQTRKVGSGAAAAAAGVVLLGPIGLAAGLLGARRKRVGVVTWTNGEQSLVEVTMSVLHSALLAAAFKATQS